MSRRNVELHARGYDAFNRRDLDSFLALIDPNAEIRTRIVTMEGGRPYRGVDGARRWWRDFLEIFPDWRVEASEIRDLGDLTIARVQLAGSGAGSGASIQDSVWHAMEWRDHRLLWWGSFRTEADALEAARLRQ
jgi:ketosteroid isomerase-like protein